VLDALGDVLVAVGRHEEAQPVLHEVLLLQMILHAHDRGEVMGARGDRGLAHLEGRKRRGPLALLEHRHARVGPPLLELHGQRQTGEPPAQDGHVVPLGGGPKRAYLEAGSLPIGHKLLSPVCSSSA
jgi:hypothetical protein